jgi:uncharacterized protein YjiS (DUF1127 family)
MLGIRNIRWIDLKPGERLVPIQQEGAVMNTQKLTSHSFQSARAANLSAASLLSQVVQTLRRWNQLARQRRQLASLSDEMLKDIGRSRADIEWEASRPFWDDPDRR